MGCGASARKKESPDKKKSDSAEGPNAEKTEEAEGTRLHKAPQTKTQDDADLFAESPRHSIGGGAISPRGSASLGVPTPRERERGRQSKVQRVTEICEALDVDATPPEGTGRSLLESGGMKACASLLRALLRPGGSFLSAHVQGGAEGEGVSRERVSAELPPGNKAEEDIFRDLADADLALRGMLGLLCEPGGTTLFRSSRGHNLVDHAAYNCLRALYSRSRRESTASEVNPAKTAKMFARRELFGILVRALKCVYVSVAADPPMAKDWLSETVCVATSLYVLEKRNEEEGGVQASAVEWSLAVLRALSREGDAFSLPSDRLSAFQKLSGVLSDCLLFLPDSPSLFDPSFKETLEPLLTSLEHALSTVAQIVQRHPSAAEEAYAECPQLWTEVSACVVFLSCWMEPPSSSSSQLAGGETEGNSEGATMKREKDESEESARREQRIVVRAAAAALVAVGAATAHAAEENAESVLEALGGPPLLTAVWCLLESCKVKHERGSEKGRQEKTEEPESEGDDKERLRSLAASVIRLFWKAPAESAHHEKAELVAATRGSQGRGASTLEHEEIN